jgi:signal transduction histidine kinase
MNGPLITALQKARTALVAVDAVDPSEAALTRTLTRDLDAAIARLGGNEPERDLVSIVCHDLKDPLASIVMGVGFLKRTIPAAESATRRVVDAISRSAERMSHVVGDFHDLAKLETGLLAIEPRPCDVVATLRGAMGRLEGEARDREIALTLEAPEKPPIAVCDHARLIQMVDKLVGNAIKFTPAKGRIVVRIESEGASVRVSVGDTGRGIPPERMSLIFDRAANARWTPRDGPGLGLAIVRGLAELQQGEISVKSTLGEGSTFSFTLPLDPPRGGS